MTALTTGQHGPADPCTECVLLTSHDQGTSRHHDFAPTLPTSESLRLYALLKRVHTTDQTRQNWSVANILKTTEDCRQLCSHRRRRPDKTVLSGGSRWCEMGFSHSSYSQIRANVTSFTKPEVHITYCHIVRGGPSHGYT